MSARTPIRLALALSLLAGAAPAQSNPQLIGLTQVTPLVLRTDVATCNQGFCPVGLPPVTMPFAGGTAYDPTDRGVFVSDGLLMAKVNPRNTSCTPLCPVLPVPNTTPNNPVTGLAYNEITNVLFITDQSGVLRWYSVGGGCQLSLIFRCLAPISSNSLLTGCATDDLNGLIFYSAIVPGNPGGRVLVAPQTAPCNVICILPITTCGTNTMGPLRGLGYDACTQTLWATDGRFTKGVGFDPSTCTFTGETQCCVNTTEPYVGLCVLPSTETPSGPACSAPTCPVCPNLAHRLGGDPTVGAAGFSLDLVNAPGGSQTVLLFNIGPCGPGFFSPPFCAGIGVPFVPPPFTSPPLPTGGPLGSCVGNVSVGIPIPPNALFCGLTISSQYIGICPGGGNFVTNCLTWTIGAS